MKSRSRPLIRRTLLVASSFLLLDATAAAKSLNYNLFSNTSGGGALIFEYDDQLSDGDYIRFNSGSNPEFISILMNDGGLGPGAEISGWTLRAPDQFATYLPSVFGGIESYAFTLLDGCVSSMTIYSSSLYDFSYTGNAIYAISTLAILGSHYTYDKSGSIDGVPLGVSEEGTIDFAPSAIPEPSASGLLLAGLGLTWLVKRRKPG